MIRLRHTLHIALGLTILGMSAVFLTSSPAMSQNQNMEVIHHPNYDKTVFNCAASYVRSNKSKSSTTSTPRYPP
jgi:hypothetical protein